MNAISTVRHFALVSLSLFVIFDNALAYCKYAYFNLRKFKKYRNLKISIFTLIIIIIIIIDAYSSVNYQL